MNDALKHSARTAVRILPAALVAGLGMPALIALVFLAILVLGVTCWVISSGDRSDRVTRMICARHGNTRYLRARRTAR
jgi:hypothetical protein